MKTFLGLQKCKLAVATGVNKCFPESNRRYSVTLLIGSSLKMDFDTCLCGFVLDILRQLLSDMLLSVICYNSLLYKLAKLC